MFEDYFVKKFTAPIGLSLVLGFTACTPKPKPPKVSPEAGVVIGKVGAAVVTDKELLERIAAIEKSYPRVYSTHVQKKSLLTEMMNTQLLYEEAIRLGLDKKYEFKSRLADLYVRELAEGARNKLSSNDIKSFFEENRYAIEQVSARHILLKTSSNMSQKEKSLLKSKIESYRTQLLKDPSQFADYAKKHSEDSSGQSGGELGFFTRGMMVAPFSNAAFNLKRVGDISEVVVTQYGFHIIQLSGDRRGMEHYQALIKEQLLRKTQRDRLNAEIARLRNGKEIQIYEDNLVKLSPLPAEITSDPSSMIPEGSVKEPASSKQENEKKK